MTNKYNTLYKWINIGIDYTLLNLALIIGFYKASEKLNWGYSSDHYLLIALILNLFWYFCSSTAELYSDILKKEAIVTLKSTLKSLIIYVSVLLAVKFFSPYLNLLSIYTTQFILIYSFLLLSWKTIFLLHRKNKRHLWTNFNKIAIIGAGPVGADLLSYFKENPQFGYAVDAVFDDDLEIGIKHGTDVKGKISECLNYVLANDIKEIYCALPDNQLSKVKPLMLEADKHLLRFRLVPYIQNFWGKAIIADSCGFLPILTHRQEPLESKANEILKRIFDIVFSSLVIIFILSWLLPVLAVLVKLDSKGPVIFKQLRSGKNGKPFYCLKLRTMLVNDDADNRQARKDDKRITRVGSILRKTSLDELPQFFNVLYGEMSVVGPRPHMIKHTEDYSIEIQHFMARHFVTPGITGWAQVNGYRGETKESGLMNKRVEADIWYLENWSIILDIRIVFLTIWKMLRGDESAF
jgi:putative colanic acid biosysnthesis UDP-glucose lipid carrier transferase